MAKRRRRRKSSTGEPTRREKAQSKRFVWTLVAVFAAIVCVYLVLELASS